MADFLSTRKDHPAAEQALLEAATQLPHSTKIQFGLAELYLKSGQDAKAREQYASLVKDYKEKPAGLEAKVKLAEMDLIAGKQAEAERAGARGLEGESPFVRWTGSLRSDGSSQEERKDAGAGVSNRVA